MNSFLFLGFPSFFFIFTTLDPLLCFKILKSNLLLKMVQLCGLIKAPTNDLTKIDEKENLGFEDCLKYGGLKFPIIKGSQRPLLRPVKTCAEINGESGLETDEPVEFPDIPKHALDFTLRLSAQTSPHFTTRMYDYFKSFAPEKIVIVAIGPLTNVALLLINHPDLVRYIEKIVLMGGSIGTGNCGPAEFNIYADPEAASFVFESGLPIYMVNF